MGKAHSLEQVSTLLMNDEKLKDSTDMANALNYFFITITANETCNKERKKMLSQF
jgi:hypothetical protein